MSMCFVLFLNVYVSGNNCNFNIFFKTVLFIPFECRYCRSHFTANTPDDYDSTNALFNGALLEMDLSSEDINDTTIDPIIDIIPETVPLSGLLPSQAFTPIVTALPNSATLEQLSELLPAVVLPTSTPTSTNCDQPTTNNRTNECAESGVAVSTPPSTAAAKPITLLGNEYESHHRQLQALKVG